MSEAQPHQTGIRPNAAMKCARTSSRTRSLSIGFLLAAIMFSSIRYNFIVIIIYGIDISKLEA
jgi:uncharacterized membrane protein YgaE (UPF0421/DUF939 family)